MRKTLLLLLLWPLPARAHVGHLGDVAGHDHWIAGAALGAAALAALWAAWKGRQEGQAEDDHEEAAEPEAQA